MEQINHSQIISKIIEAEQAAQQVADEARQKMDALPAEINAEKEKMRAAYLERAQRRIEIIKSVEYNAADEATAELDQKLKDDLANVEQAYAQNKDAWAAKIFSLVTGR